MRKNTNPSPLQRLATPAQDKRRSRGRVVRDERRGRGRGGGFAQLMEDARDDGAVGIRAADGGRLG